VVDANNLQAMDFLTNILESKPYGIVKKIRGFGLKPKVCNGHDMSQLLVSLRRRQLKGCHLPNVVVAKTVKGFGLKCMENIPKFHFRIPTREELLRG
jgi:transketolase